MIEYPETEQASVVFLGRESFRMQVVGAPAVATNGAIPSSSWETPTERIFERRKAPRVPQPVPGSPPASTPALTKTTMVGVGFITFACGALFATAVDRVRPHAGSPARITHLEQVVAAAPAVQTPPPVPAPAPSPLPSVQPLPKAEPEALAVLTAQPLSPPPTAPATKLETTKLETTKPETTKPETTKPETTKAATVAPAPRARVVPAPARPRRPAHAAPTIEAAELLWDQPAGEKASATTKAPVSPPTPGKWVDPFAE